MPALAPDDPAGARAPHGLRKPTRGGTRATSRTRRAGTCRCRPGTASTTTSRSRSPTRSSGWRDRRDGERCFVDDALHEDMHGEALLMTLQTLALPGPAGLGRGGTGRPGRAKPPTRRSTCRSPAALRARHAGWRGRTLRVGQRAVAPPKSIWRRSRCARCVSAGAFAEFVDDGGYVRRAVDATRDDVARAARAQRIRRPWRRAIATRRGSSGYSIAGCPCARRAGAARERVRSRGLVPLGGSAPAHRDGVGIAGARTRGEHLDHARRAVAAAQACHGLPLLGNVWEWTSTPFLPFPGFAAGAYAEYSAPWFGDHRVLRGGSWATRARLVHAAFRNFYVPNALSLRGIPYLRTAPCGVGR